MPKLIVRKPLRFPHFGASKWRRQDHETPLTLRLSHATALIYLEEELYRPRNLPDIIVYPRGRLELVYDPAPASLIPGLSSRGAASTSTAESIYGAYLEAHSRFEALLFSAGKVRYQLRTEPDSLANFFSDSGFSYGAVEWSLDGSGFAPFKPKLTRPRGRNPLYTAAQLVTPGRWRDMQRSADDSSYPEGELLELYRIRAKVYWRDVRTAAIEASIISESLLRDYGLKTLKEGGFSNTKIKRLRDEMTFNNLLNIVLPLSLKKGELRRIQSAIDVVDRLRAIRNDLVHGNITTEEVEAARVEEGIEGAISLVRFLQRRLA